MPTNKQCPTEHQEQSAFFEWWNMWSKGLPYIAFAIPNGGARNPATGAMLKREGVLSGVPDIFVAWPRNGKHGLFIEMKKRVGSSTSAEQKQRIAELERAGYECHVCKGWEEARDVVREYSTRAEMPENEGE